MHKANVFRYLPQNQFLDILQSDNPYSEKFLLMLQIQKEYTNSMFLSVFETLRILVF